MKLRQRLRAWFRRDGKSRHRSRRPRFEALEDRTLPASVFHFDFGTPGSPVATGYTGVNLAPYSVAKGYGWKATTSLSAHDRLTADPLTRDLHRGKSSMFLVDLPNGVYDVSFTLGDPHARRDNIELRAEAQLLATNVTTAAGGVYRSTFQVVVSDGQLALRLIDRGGSNAYFAINGLDILPSSGPIVNAGSDQTTTEGNSVSFAGTASGNGPLSYHWDFGDGATSDGSLTPTHTYADNGSYTAALTVTDANGLSSTDAAIVNVANVAPTPSHGGPYSGGAGTSITFAATATDPSSVDTAAGFAWSWNFGDGHTSTQRIATHAYASPGTYTVTLSAADKDGAKTTVTTTASVTSGGAENWIITHHDRVPNYGKSPTIVSVASGPWSNVATWSLGRLPQTGDVVAIMPSTTVTYDLASNMRLNTVAVRPGGELTFRTDVSTRMVVANLLVLEGGGLTVGTETNPIRADVQAEIIIASQALNTLFDPQQYGTALLGWGRVTMHGAARSASFVRLAAEPMAGQTTLSLAEAVTGWRPGDRIFLPDSRQLRDVDRGANYVPRWEEATIQSISADGKTLTLAGALKYNHPGARNGDGVLEFLPHVGNLTRNVVVRSENPLGTRGHVQLFHEAEVDVRYVQFKDLGRTTNDPLDNTTFNADGTVHHIGTNQIGRYPLHIHHVVGPHDIPANGFQFTLIGNALDGGTAAHNRKWGITLHDSHYGLIRDNVVYNVAGAGVVTEDGSESYNLIERNFVARVIGTGNRVDNGREGLGFWFRGPNNDVRNNVASSVGGNGGSGAASYGFNYFLYYVGNVTIPTEQGHDPHDGGVVVDMNALPIREFSGNEAYGAMPGGLTFWHIGTFGDWPNDKISADSVFQNFRVWHHYDFGVYGYPSDRVVFDGLQIRGDPSIVTNPYENVTGITFGDYPTRNLVIKNANIQGMRVGIDTPYVAPGVTNIRDSYLRNVTDVAISTMYSVNGSGGLPAKKTVLANLRFAALPGLSHRAIAMNYDTAHGNNLVKKDEVFVYDYNGVPGQNYRVYYNEQKANFIVPKSSGSLIGAPVAGLTNAQAWATYGIAIAGEVAPATATTKSDIHGLVVPI